MADYIQKNWDNFWIFVREEVKDILLKIEKNLKEKWYFLALKIGYRPLQVQKNLFKKIFEFYKEENLMFL